MECSFDTRKHLNHSLHAQHLSPTTFMQARRAHAPGRIGSMDPLNLNSLPDWLVGWVNVELLPLRCN